MLSQTPPNGPGLLWAKVKGLVLLSTVKQTELSTLGLRNHSQDAGNVFTDLLTAT